MRNERQSGSFLIEDKIILERVFAEKEEKQA
jgi:hypothetical protein